jgi:hypothetical protein
LHHGHTERLRCFVPHRYRSRNDPITRWLASRMRYVLLSQKKEETP